MPPPGGGGNAPVHPWKSPFITVQKQQTQTFFLLNQPFLITVYCLSQAHPKGSKY